MAPGRDPRGDDVPGSDSRARRPRRRFRRRDALGRRVPRRSPRAGVSRASARSAWARRSWRSAASTTRQIRLREPVLEPDALIIQDATLLHQVDLFDGPAPQAATVLINSTRQLDELGLGGFARGRRERYRLFTLPATETRAQARRPRGAECGAARRLSPRSPASIALDIRRRRDPREVSGKDRREERRRRDRSIRARERRRQESEHA